MDDQAWESWILDQIADRPQSVVALIEIAIEEIHAAKWALLDSGRAHPDRDLRLVPGLSPAAEKEGPSNG